MGTQAFWSTLVALPVILGMATLLGRAITSTLPYRLRARATIYLSPLVGLAFLMVFVAVLGRYTPLGTSPVIVALVVLATGASLAFDRQRRVALSHVACMSLFALATSVGLLVSVYLIGVFNLHNDSFTYLAISDWLQTNAFNTPIAAENITPASTQVVMYQQNGYRMGASFLMALFQGLLNARDALEVFPAIVITAVAAGGFAAGYPLSRVAPTMPRWVMLLVLALPPLGLGGVSFAAYYGFLPQLFGLAFGAGYLFILNDILLDHSAPRPAAPVSIAALALAALLCAASALSYSELLPFLLAASVMSAVSVAIRTRKLLKIVLSGLLIAIFLAVFLNVEMPRIYQALLGQSGAVVGGPVDWRVWGFLAHAFGFHGGAWDILQWARNDAAIVANLIGYCGLALLLLVLAFRLVGASAWRAFWQVGTSVWALLLFGLAFAYFRYGASNPFAIGTGQSWSQFKIVEWVQPFVFVSAVAVLFYRVHIGRVLVGMLTAFFLFAAGTSVWLNATRSQSMATEYYGANDIQAFFAHVHETSEAVCGPFSPIYLDLPVIQQKMKQMLAWSFPDREVTGNWVGDDYVEPRIPAEQRAALPNKNDCIISAKLAGAVGSMPSVGPLVFEKWLGDPRIRILSVDSANSQESDDTSWWLWVAKRADIALQVLPESAFAAGGTWTAEVVSATAQTVSVTMTLKDGTTKTHQFPIEPGTQLVEWPLEPMAEPPVTITVATDEVAVPIGRGDNRTAAFLLRGMELKPSP